MEPIIEKNLGGYSALTGEYFISSMKQKYNAINTQNSITRKSIALILAGGRGTRLKQLTDWRAKPAVPFGGKFRIVDFPLSNCVNSGVRRISVITQYKAQSLIQHIQRGWSFLDGRFNEYVELLPAQQQIKESWYQGTADAVFQNIDFLRRHSADYVLILGGDHVYKMNYETLLAEHANNNAELTVACVEVPRSEASAFGIMAVDDEWRVTDFIEKPEDPPSMPGHPEKSLVSMGIYVFNTEFLFDQLIRDHQDENSAHDFGRNLIPYLVPGHRVYAHRFLDSCVNKVRGIPYWRDVGTVEAYWEANLDLTRIKPDLNLYDQNWPIWTHQEQLPPAKFVFNNEERHGRASDSLVSGGCIISGGTVNRSLLFSGVKVNSFSHVEDAVILPNVNIGRKARLRKVVVEKNCIIPEGLEVGFDSEADSQQFHVTDNGITLITPEMLGQKIHYSD